MLQAKYDEKLTIFKVIVQKTSGLLFCADGVDPVSLVMVHSPQTSTSMVTAELLILTLHVIFETLHSCLRGKTCIYLPTAPCHREANILLTSDLSRQQLYSGLCFTVITLSHNLM